MFIFFVVKKKVVLDVDTYSILSYQQVDLVYKNTNLRR